MAEAIGLAASIIAVVQLADRISSVCKYLIDTEKDYPRDLRLIYVETGSLNIIFEGLRFLDEDDPADSATLQRLRGSNGPIEGCKTAIVELNKLFPPFPLSNSNRKGTKKLKLNSVLAALAWPLKAEKSRKFLDEIMRHKSTINVALQGQLMKEFRDMKHQLDEVCDTLNASEKRKVYEWYQDTNPSSSHNAAEGLYEEGTGDWVFETSDWDDWLNARIRSLWLHGIPGAGKTVLVAHIIEHIFHICETNDKHTTCVYYYCYHGHNQDESVPFLRWLTSQLLRQTDTVPLVAWKAYTLSREPDKTLLLEILHAILDCFDLVYVVIDALDESQSRLNLLGVLAILATDTRFQKIQLLAASREYADIEHNMSRFSQSLSMSNSFVEADIKHFVAAKIMAEAKFQRWPSDLRAEVEGTLSTGARGMFRWAVCQLDILRRLNDQLKIKAAIKFLPKSLDETYERIFSCIPDEEKEFVRHALHWVCFHDHLWKGKIALCASNVIESYIAMNKDQSNSQEFLYDLETLKDSCGCLMSFTLDNNGELQLANIAHYTVREFLESNRASSTSWFSIRKNISYGLFLNFAFEYAITSKHAHTVKSSDDAGPKPTMKILRLYDYCLITSVHSFLENGGIIEPRLALRFLNPTEAHFKHLQELIPLFLNEGIDALSAAKYYHYKLLSGVKWQESTKNSEAILLVNLLIMKCYGMAKDLIEHVDKESIFKKTLSGSINRSIFWIIDINSGHARRSFKCNLVELLAVIHALDTEMLEFFQQEACELIFYDNLLPYYMPGHSYFYMERCDISCTLTRLLQLGAKSDPQGFQVTPLQIAVFARDISGVRSILEAGADPNNTGEELGIKHDRNSILGPYRVLHRLSPLYILRHLKAHPYGEAGMSVEDIKYITGSATAKIDCLLLNYNAIEFMEERLK